MSDIIPGTTEYVALNQVPDASSPMIPIQKDSNIPKENLPARLPESPWLPNDAENTGDSAVVEEIDKMLKVRAANMSIDPQGVVMPQQAPSIRTNNMNPRGQTIVDQASQPDVVPQFKPRTGVDTTPVIIPEGLLDPQKPVGWWKKLLRRG